MNARKEQVHDRATATAVGYLVVSGLILLSGMLYPESASGQGPRWEVDLNGSRMKYDTMAALNAPSLSSLAEWQRPSLFGRLSGSVTGFESAGWSLQGRGDLAGWLSPFGTLSPVRLELAGTAGGSRHSSGFDAAVGRVDARLHVRSRSVGLWAGAGVTSARSSFDTASVTGVVPSAGLWAQSGPVRATLSFLRTDISGDAYPEANAAVSLSRGMVDLTVYGGLRQSPFDGVDGETWAGGTGAIWVHPRAALVVSGGQYSSDLMQGLPGGEFVSVGIRFTPRRARPIPVSTQAPIVYTADAARAGRISFDVQDARRVEIAGDWNAWQAEPLTRNSAGRWILPADLAPGVHRFNLRVDGERWIVPEGFPEIEDGFGDRVGLLIISNQP